MTFEKGNKNHWKKLGYTIWNKGKKSPKTTGKLNGNWKGGSFVSKLGYKFLYMPKHPNVNAYGYIREHRFIVEQNIGRLLKREEEVHHIDYDKLNNVIENLYVFSSRKSHADCKKSIFGMIKPLLKAGIISFDKSKEEYIYEEKDS